MKINLDGNFKDNHTVIDFSEKELYQIDLSKTNKEHFLKELTSFKNNFNHFDTLNQNSILTHLQCLMVIFGLFLNFILIKN